MSDTGPREALPSLLAKVRVPLIFAILAASALLATLWLWRTWNVMPAVSLADFVLAMAGRIEMIGRGDFLGILWKCFEPFGGHIVAYERVLQLINFVFFDYSPDVVKITGILTLIVAFCSFGWLALRQFGLTLSGVVMLALGYWLIASPTLYTLIAWPDSLPSYYSVFIVACLMLPWCNRLYSSKTSLRMLVIASLATAFAIIIGSGVGWVVLVVLPLQYLFASGLIDRVVQKATWRTFVAAFVVIVGVVIAALFGALQLFKAFETQFVLDEPRRGLELAVTHFDVVLQYFFAVLATNFVLGDIYSTWIFGAVPFAFFVVILGQTILQRRSQDTALWIALCLLGLGSVALTTLARWHFVIIRDLTMAGQYYSVFALPFYVGLAGLVIHAVRARPAHANPSPVWLRATLAAVSAGLVSVAVYQIYLRQPVYDQALKERADFASASLFGAANRNLALTAEVSGPTLFVYRYQTEIIPAFKRHGKYRAISEKFIPTARDFLVANKINPDAALPESGPDCAQGRSGSRLMSREIDVRKEWRRSVDPAGAYVRFVGAAYDADGCTQPAEYVAAMDSSGRLMCVSRPGKENVATAPAFHKIRDPADLPAQFDFSCPIDSAAVSDVGQMNVVAFSSKRGSFTRLPFDAAPTDLVQSTGEISVKDGQSTIQLNDKTVRIDETRAGWMSNDAGQISGDSVVLSGWVLDRLRNQTAELVLVFADDKLIYSAVPTVPNSAAENGATLNGKKRAGFEIWLMRSQAFKEDGSKRTLRIFALTADNVALEAYYPETFPFRAPQ